MREWVHDHEDSFIADSRIFSGLFSLAIGQAALAEDDQIFLNQGASLRGKIGQVSPSQIEIIVGGESRQLKTNEIRLINFADEPDELRQGEPVPLLENMVPL